MSQPIDQIAHWRKMSTDDPENDLAHYRLGQELMKAGQYEEAVQSFRRTLQLSPEFSRVFQMLGSALIELGRRDEAISVVRQGFEIADARGDNMPRDEMARMLTGLGEPAPVSKKASGTNASAGGATDGFHCRSPRHMSQRSLQLPRPPINDEIGRRIYESVCADCWQDWLRNYSIKVINELRLDLSTELGQAEYDRYMREFLGLD
jgi:tetratricopeptide (TPR) repeat protein